MAASTASLRAHAQPSRFPLQRPANNILVALLFLATGLKSNPDNPEPQTLILTRKP